MISTRQRVHTDSPYDVLVGAAIGGELPALVGDAAGKVAMIFSANCERRVHQLRRELVTAGYDVHLIAVPDGEAAKTAKVAEFCWQVLGQTGFTRSDAIVGVGGGATTDLAGFVAATWLRGVRLVTVPTTVLGMVDAAVGGKTGVNTGEGKNLVGAFHEPAGVLCDLEALSSLPAAEVRSGLAEVVKCGFIADATILELIEAAPSVVMATDSQILAELIAKGIAVKADAVAGDLRDSGPRAEGSCAGASSAGGSGAEGSIGREALNYGHTLGHAIERRENYAFRHGEAVAIGMVFAAELARLDGRITADLVARHRDVFGLVGLPRSYRPGVWEELHASMRLDKKARGSQLRFVVLDGLAAPAILSGPGDGMLAEAYKHISS